MTTNRLLNCFGLVFFFVCGINSFSQNNFWIATGGPSGGYVNALAIHSNGTLFIGTQNSGIHRSSDNGDTWNSLGLKSETFRTVAVSTNGSIYAGATSGVFLSTDDGSNWTRLNNSPANTRAIIFNSEMHVFLGAATGVFRSTDSGTTWVAVNNGLTNADIRSLIITSGGVIFAGASGTNGSIFRSSDNGGSWTNAGFQATLVQALISPTNGTIFAGVPGASAGVYRSTDDGATWTQTVTGLTNKFVATFAADGNWNLFVGVVGGVFRSMDNGASWTQINSGLTSTDVRSLAVNSKNILFAGTYGGGVFRSTQPTTAVRERVGRIPSNFSLEQNYPNPVGRTGASESPSTTIRFSLPSDEYIFLTLHDIQGKKVAVLANGLMRVGNYDVNVGVDQLSGGIYFYRLLSGKFFAVRKMVVMQ